MPRPLSLRNCLTCSSGHHYYHARPGETIALAFPPNLRRAKKTGRKSREAKPSDNSPLQAASPSPITHTPEQTTAINEITEALAGHRFSSFLLHGITGSGKTEVYLASAIKTLEMGRSVLYLVPEIALTPQTIAMIQRRIPYEMAVIHSGLTPAARAKEFMKICAGRAPIVLGTRSAIFAPLTNLGLIVVDEEHDHSYKQDEGVTYNARDLGLLRAKNNHAVIILGSATPSIEIYSKMAEKKIRLLTMSSRTGDASLPCVEIIDMKGEKDPISPRLSEAIEATLAKNEQVLLYINRRGFSAALVCPGCGTTLKCTSCDRSLTYHRKKAQGLCHYCGYTLPVPEICPRCGCLDMKMVGLGTEKILHSVKKLFPDARILRMDSDEITTSGRLYAALESITRREVDIIVGTQMISKGHDFPDLTLVGVMHAEQMLFMPDFRAGERTFQQVVQVAGRAGRRAADTRVMIQTLIPDHPLIQSIATYDYQSMLASELTIREATVFPPYVHMSRCIFSSPHSDAARKAASLAAETVNIRGVSIRGPAPAPVSLLRNKYRWHLVLTSRERPKLHASLDLVERLQLPAGVNMKIDVDPYSMT